MAISILTALQTTIERIKTWADSRYLKTINVDVALDAASTNPVQNKVVQSAIQEAYNKGEEALTTAQRTADNLANLGNMGAPDWNAAEGETGHIRNRTHYTEGDKVYKLDNKYLDVDWIPKEYFEELIAPEKEIEGAVGRGFEGAAVEKLAAGDLIAIYYDGVRYVSPVVSLEGDALYAGNLGIINGYSGLPFFITMLSSGRINFTINDMEKHIASIYKLVPNIKMPVNLLPDGVPYLSGGSVEVLPETTFASEYMLAEPLGLIEGEIYTVVYYSEAYENEMVFEIPCIKLEVEGLSVMALGNVYAIAEGAEGIVPTDEPFVVLEYPMSMQGMRTAIADVTGSESVTISINKSNLRKLPAECMPDGYYTGAEVDIALENKANIEHKHLVADIEDFKTALDEIDAKLEGKADSSHGTHVSYGTSATAVGTTAGAGSASTVSRSDHTHSLNKNAVITALGYTPPTNNTNTTYDLTASASSTNGNVKLNLTAGGSGSGTDSVSIKGSGTTTVTTDANGVITINSTDNDTIYTHPAYTARTGKPTANQTPAFGGTATVSQITSDGTGHVTGATDRTITIPSTLSNGTGTAGLIKTTSTVTSNSGYTACPVISGVPYYKDTSNTYTLGSFGITATATELNYVDGVTSAIQTQLNGKLSTSGTAAKATADANGKNIASTYATKTEVSTQINNAISGLSFSIDNNGVLFIG